MSAGSIWMVVGLAFCGAELLHPGVFLLWIGLAAIAAGGVTWAAGLDFSGQVAAFVVLVSASLWVSARRMRRRRGLGAGVNAPDGGLVGKTCRALAFAGAEGRVSVRDGTWPARMSDGSSPAPGAPLRIVGLDGTTLIVSPA